MASTKSLKAKLDELELEIGYMIDDERNNLFLALSEIYDITRDFRRNKKLELDGKPGGKEPKYENFMVKNWESVQEYVTSGRLIKVGFNPKFIAENKKTLLSFGYARYNSYGELRGLEDKFAKHPKAFAALAKFCPDLLTVVQDDDPNSEVSAETILQILDKDPEKL